MVLNLTKYLSTQPLQQSVLQPYTGGNTVVIYKGYVHELCPEHPKANFWGYLAQHRLVYERHHGVYLKDGVDIHHINGRKDDNRIKNLHPCTRSEHMALHRAERREQKLLPLDHETVRAALLKTKNLKKACAILGCHTQTIRNRFPDLVEPHKRRSPCSIDDPETIEQIRLCAADPAMGFRETALHCGIHWQTVRRICEKHGFEWTKRARVKRVPQLAKDQSTKVTAPMSMANIASHTTLSAARDIPLDFGQNCQQAERDDYREGNQKS